MIPFQKRIKRIERRSTLRGGDSEHGRRWGEIYPEKKRVWGEVEGVRDRLCRVNPNLKEIIHGVKKILYAHNAGRKQGKG